MIKYLGKGRMRMAFKVGKHAVKIPYNLSGIKACLEERMLWKRHRSSAMAPIKFSIPGLCVVMPYYADEFTGDKPEAFISKLNEFGIVDLHPYNLRLVDGEPIAIDYAVNKSSHGIGEPTGGWKCDLVAA